MSKSQTQGILNQMSNIVLGYLDKHELKLNENSSFAQELCAIQVPERREMLRTYLCDSTYFLLHGIIDHVHSLNIALNVPSPAVVSVSPYVLARATLEYVQKLVYLTYPLIEDRIQRSLRCYCADIREYRKLPEDLTSQPARQLAENNAILAEKWHCELTGGSQKLRPITALEIFEAVEEKRFDEEGQDLWVTDGKGTSVPFAYAKGYRIFSAVTHSNLWAIRHFGMTKIGNKGDVTLASSGLDLRGVLLFKLSAAMQLQFSFGFAVQFMSGHLPAGTMNRLGAQIGLIQEALAQESD